MKPLFSYCKNCSEIISYEDDVCDSCGDNYTEDLTDECYWENGPAIDFYEYWEHVSYKNK